MKTLIAATALVCLAATPALADHHMAKPHMTSTGWTVVETDAKGKATKVSKDGMTYAVCTSDNSDNCINPREAGLKWGNVPLTRWPGKPASSR